MEFTINIAVKEPSHPGYVVIVYCKFIPAKTPKVIDWPGTPLRTLREVLEEMEIPFPISGFLVCRKDEVERYRIL